MSFDAPGNNKGWYDFFVDLDFNIYQASVYCTITTPTLAVQKNICYLKIGCFILQLFISPEICILRIWKQKFRMEILDNKNKQKSKLYPVTIVQKNVQNFNIFYSYPIQQDAIGLLKKKSVCLLYIFSI